jgi:hypothetical protein
MRPLFWRIKCPRWIWFQDAIASIEVTDFPQALNEGSGVRRLTLTQSCRGVKRFTSSGWTCASGDLLESATHAFCVREDGVCGDRLWRRTWANFGKLPK